METKVFQSRKGSPFAKIREGEPERIREDSGCVLGEKEDFGMSESSKTKAHATVQGVQGESSMVKHSGSPLPIDHDTLLVEEEGEDCSQIAS